jgi:hypothetical protein
MHIWYTPDESVTPTSVDLVQKVHFLTKGLLNSFSALTLHISSIPNYIDNSEIYQLGVVSRKLVIDIYEKHEKIFIEITMAAIK